MKKCDYTLIRSRRRSISVEITPDLTVLVRAPLRCPLSEINAFVDRHREWIARHMDRQRQHLENHPEPSAEKERILRERAAALIPARVAFYAGKMGLSPAGISITGAKTRFGSCSGKNRLSFSWRLADYPDEAIDAVVVHELAHIVHKNHGPDFYALVESVLPDYRERIKLLSD
ncbi:MAG: M48 family metallopeptidase [Oscillospiraceae bacterium]|nr:M48 family metallopeptidase [Oscillospiraceae bacterium]